jgi:predicted double-glycine peptidase
MKRYAASLNVPAAGYKAEVKDLLTLTEPAIVPIDYGGAKHFVVLRGIRDGVAYIADPSAGNLAFSVQEFATLWDKNTLFILSAPAGQRAPAQLALNDQELGVVDMDRVTNRGQLDPFNNTTQLLERAVNSGPARTWMHRQ